MKAFEPIATNPTVGTVYLMIEFDEQWALEGLRRLDSQAIGAIYDRYFPEDAPARIFMHVPSWPGPFDVEIDCVAVLG